MNQDKYLTIGALTKYLKFKFDTDENLRSVFLKGEISNLKAHTTGHYYFSLKDETSKINAIMFANNVKFLNFVPKDGMKVLVSGRISVYEATGNYQIYVDEMLEDGLGDLHIKFEKLKEKLSKEGLFDQEHKRPIPKIPKKIGIVTASTGAAIKDILSTIERRYPICETYLFPSLVQGENAANDIVKKINQANTYDLDVLIVGRGGGSIEDLWPFNEEVVARAIYDSKIPIISAVGHEVDFTIADFVADLRAPTPTGAAEIAVPNIVDVKKHIEQLNIRLTESIYKKVNINRLLLDSIKNSYMLKSPLYLLEGKKQTLDIIIDKLNNYYSNLVSKNEEKLTYLIDKLNLLNPLNTLKRGYSLTYLNDKIISSVNSIKKDDIIKVQLANGNISTKVIDIKEEKNEI